MTDDEIIGLYFARSENAISETDIKYGKLCSKVIWGILYDRRDSEECLNDTWMACAVRCGKNRNHVVQLLLWLVYGVIFVYYIIAALFPVDKMIGNVYPVFGGVLMRFVCTGMCCCEISSVW